MNRLTKAIIVVFLVGVLMLIRGFEETLFYDPLTAFYKSIQNYYKRVHLFYRVIS